LKRKWKMSKFVQAVKAHRAATACGLEEAKKYVRKHGMIDCEENADAIHQEYMDNLSEWELEMRHKILNGEAEKATFHYTVESLRDTPEEGWLMPFPGNEWRFVWAHEQGYNHYTIRLLANSGGFQYICTGGGKIPLGWAVTLDRCPECDMYGPHHKMDCGSKNYLDTK
jgi:hypothetical protein